MAGRPPLRAAEDARLGKELLEPGVLRGRAIEQLDEPLPPLRVEHELRAVGEQALGLEDGSVDDEVRERALRRLRRVADEPVRLRVDAEVPPLLDLVRSATPVSALAPGPEPT